MAENKKKTAPVAAKKGATNEGAPGADPVNDAGAVLPGDVDTGTLPEGGADEGLGIDPVGNGAEGPDAGNGADTPLENAGDGPAALPEVPPADTKAKATRKVEPSIPRVGKDTFRRLAEEYGRLYPECRCFHITEDGQVFLEANLREAQAHQRSLEEGEVHTIEVK